MLSFFIGLYPVLFFLVVFSSIDLPLLLNLVFTWPIELIENFLSITVTQALFALGAILLGRRALILIKNSNDHMKGRLFAIQGITFGSFSLIYLVISFILSFFPPLYSIS